MSMEVESIKTDLSSKEELEKYNQRQRRIYENKVKHGFNVTDFHKEVRYILGEVAELNQAIDNKDMQNLMEEIADIVIFCYGLAEMAGDSLDSAIFEKMYINENRVYQKRVDGEFEKIVVDCEEVTEGYGHAE